MNDLYTKIILTVIAINLTVIVASEVLTFGIPEAGAQQTISVYVEGGTLDYETDITGGPTLKVCTDC